MSNIKEITNSLLIRVKMYSNEKERAPTKTCLQLVEHGNKFTTRIFGPFKSDICTIRVHAIAFCKRNRFFSSSYMFTWPFELQFKNKAEEKKELNKGIAHTHICSNAHKSTISIT